MAENPHTPPRINKLIELEVSGRIKPQHQQELDTYRAQGLAPKKSASATPTESENTAAFLATRVSGGLDDITRAVSEDKGAAGEGVFEVLAGGLGGRARNMAVSPERQRVIAAQIDVLDSALTLGTGAAYTTEQLEGYRQSYFPQLGDDKTTIADKQRRLNRLIEAARVKSGRAATKIDEALDRARTAEFGEIDPTQPKEVVGLQEGAERAIEDAAGMNDGARMSVDIPADGSSQSPEFRAGLQKLLDDPNSTKQDILDYWNKNAPGALNGDEPPQPPRENPDGATGAFARGFGDIPTAGFLDEAGALVDTLGGTEGRPNIFQEGNPGFGKAFGENLRMNQQIIGADEEFHPVARGVGQLAGAVAVPFGSGARGARELAKVGGGLGALYGAGSGETLSERITGAGAGGVAGAAGGLVLGKLSDVYMARRAARTNRPPPGGEDAVAIARAAADENIPISRPIVDPTARTPAAYLESTIGGSGRVRQSLGDTASAIEERAGSLGAGGNVQDPGVVGQMVQDAGIRYIGRSKSIGGRMYERAEKASRGKTILASDAVKVIDENIAELSANANSNRPLINYLQELRADLVDESGNMIPKDVQSIRALRTGMRGQISERNLTATDAERRVGQVLDAARADIGRDLGSTAPEAVRLYERADKFHQQRMSEIRQVVQKVIGRKDDMISGEQVFSRLQTMASSRGDANRLRRMVDKLEPEEQADYAATVAASLGRRSPEEDFSPALFIGSARKLSPEARRTIFGKDGARTIDNLVKVSEGYRDAIGALNNSRSGVVQNWGGFLRGVLAPSAPVGIGVLAGGLPGGIAGAALGAGMAGAAAGARNLSARALMSPDMSRWLANAATQKTPAAIEKHVRQLSVVAARDPTIRNEVLELQSRLASSFTEPMRSAAAENDPGDVR